MHGRSCFTTLGPAVAYFGHHIFSPSFPAWTLFFFFFCFEWIVVSCLSFSAAENIKPVDWPRTFSLYTRPRPSVDPGSMKPVDHFICRCFTNMEG